MGEILMSAAFLIIVVMILRRLSGGRISMRFRYALWLIVVLRLVVPVSFGSSPFSILNLMAEWPDDAVDTAEGAQEDELGYRLTDGIAEGTGKDMDAVTEDMAGTGAAEDTGDTGNGSITTARGITGKVDGEDREIAVGIHSIRDVTDLMRDRRIHLAAMVIWGVGAAAVGGYMLISRRRFIRYLHRKRREVSVEDLPGFWVRRLEVRKIRVYLVEELPSPCLVGRDIYIGPGLLKERTKLQHVLAHEYTHAVQGDTLWAFVRSLLCAVYWFYPLVWLAAYESKKDSELSCDEYAIRILGEKERFAYGRTLLVLLSDRDKTAGCAGAVLIMGGRENGIKERITMIAGKRRNSKASAAVVAVTVACICGCAFTGAAGKGKTILLTNMESRIDVGMEETEEGEQAQAEQYETEQWNAESGMDERTEDEVQQRAGRRQREESARDEEDVRLLGAENAAFREVLYSAEDSELASASTVDVMEYYDYLYENGELPVTDGKWYRLLQKEETGIDFYGLYTQDYGFRGLKIKIGDDVNTFDEPWLPAAFGVDVAILEESGTDGMPRSFAFQMCVVNNVTSEIWRLYVADRYDTGTIELNCFESYDYREQLEKQGISLSLNREAQKVNLIYEGDVVIGSVDISDYADEKIEEAVWDAETAGFSLEEDEDGRITFLTGIGLRAAEENKTFYHGLSMIGCPVEIGSFGNREFIMGKPYVSENRVSVKLNY